MSVHTVAWGPLMQDHLHRKRASRNVRVFQFPTFCIKHVYNMTVACFRFPCMFKSLQLRWNACMSQRIIYRNLPNNRQNACVIKNLHSNCFCTNVFHWITSTGDRNSSVKWTYIANAFFVCNWLKACSEFEYNFIGICMGSTVGNEYDNWSWNSPGGIQTWRVVVTY